MTLRFKITVAGQNKHIEYTDELNSKNSRNTPINAGNYEWFIAEASGDGDGRVTVAVALLAGDKHKEVPRCATPKDNQEFTIVDTDL